MFVSSAVKWQLKRYQTASRSLEIFTMVLGLLLVAALFVRLELTLAFLLPPAGRRTSNPSSILLKNQIWNQDMDEASRRKAQGGMAETAAGAVLGRLLLGPFGMSGNHLKAANTDFIGRICTLHRYGLLTFFLWCRCLVRGVDWIQLRSEKCF
jgi:hypothetical protein